ncbi:unnamed protein product [Prunus armeniaca]|uniref:Uncharacterized protein n=1 Tax=Prunus armeniaca TaxID=36596 RepID=A0A6J5W3W1_PRUAR|nr:unnamed protein product [Prunus armeniaca]
MMTTRIMKMRHPPKSLHSNKILLQPEDQEGKFESLLVEYSIVFKLDLDALSVAWDKASPDDHKRTYVKHLSDSIESYDAGNCVGSGSAIVVYA